MKRLSKNKRGQFVIIAVLLIAVMIISVAATMHRAATYYKHEPWDEYSTLISNIELSSRRLVELSLANYTRTSNASTLRNNLAKWQTDLTSMYPGYGIALRYTLSEGPSSILGRTFNFDRGLNQSWGQRASFSIAKANFTLDVTSIGLNGYKFSVLSLVNVTVRNVLSASGGKLLINVTITDENRAQMTGLKKENFLPEGFTYTNFGVTAEYDQTYSLIYMIACEGVAGSPSPVWVRMWDSRGIHVRAKYP